MWLVPLAQEAAEARGATQRARAARAPPPTPRGFVQVTTLYVALLLFCMVVLLLYLVLRVKMLSYLRSRRELFKPVESPPPEKV